MSVATREWRAFVAAVQFLTRIPFAGKAVLNERDYTLSMAWYPAVGIVVGALFLLPLLFLSGPENAQFVSALMIAVWVVATGALHLDGLADCADAWVGGFGDRKKTLRILKDSRVGPIAVVALVVVLLLKWSAVAAMVEQNRVMYLWLIPVMSRTAMIVAFQNFTYISKEGLGSVLVTGDVSESSRLIVSHAITGILLVSFLPVKLLFVWVLVGLAIYYCWQQSCANRLGGFNGDCAGALLELLETGWLVSGVIFMSSAG